MNFSDLERHFVNHIRWKVRNGEISERGIARITGVSQPHIHHFLKGKRSLSRRCKDLVLKRLDVDLLDIIPPEEFLLWGQRR